MRSPRMLVDGQMSDSDGDASRQFKQFSLGDCWLVSHWMMSDVFLNCSDRWTDGKNK